MPRASFLHCSSVFLASFALALFTLDGCIDPQYSQPAQNNTAITQGEPDTNPDHMAVVAIQIASVGLCSGTLIADDLVLTAAHCTYGHNPSSLTVLFGNSTSSVVASRTGSEVYVHPDWHSHFLTGDISVIRLSSPAPQNIEPIAHLPSELRLTVADEGQTLEFSGFGRDENNNVGQKLRVENILDKVCPGPESCFLYPGGVTPKAFGYQSTGEPGDGGPCSGDSGGPAFIIRNVQGADQEFVAGVTSYGDAECSYYGVSTDASAYAQWIENVGVDEDCDNLVDDDEDGYTDCSDADCAGFANCTTAVDTAPRVACGSRVRGNTQGGDVQFTTYSPCYSGDTTWDGPERAYWLDIPEGTVVQAELQLEPLEVPPDSTTGDLDLFLLSGVGEWNQCLDKSTESGGTPENISFAMPAQGAYLVVDTWDMHNTFELAIDCEGIESCDNGIDEDNDGLFDCEDPECATNAYCIGPETDCADQTDNDSDTFVDCEDTDCQYALACSGQNACTEAYRISCGERLSGTTAGGHSLFDKNDCLGDMGFEEGPEVAYQVDAPAGVTVTALLDIDDSATSSDLDFFLHAAAGDTCNLSECLGSSGNQDQTDEEIEFIMPTHGAYLLVETWTVDQPAAYEIEISCVGVEDCDNQSDDDGDNLTDCDDPDCTDSPACQPVDEVCDNDIDDDGDSLVDCDDSDCAADTACQPVDEICDNDIDDDGDSLADCDDPDCAAAAACQPVDEICDNDIDDDGDSLADCDDPDCAAAAACQAADEICDNDIDDDGDSLVDCDDSDCAAAAACQAVDEICDNQFDDDSDGLVDCDDDQCQDDAACESDSCGCGVHGSRSPTGLLLVLLGFALLRRRKG